MNKYKIDINSYVSGPYKYALYVKHPWHWRWELLESFETVEDAKKAHAILASMPIYLTE